MGRHRTPLRYPGGKQKLAPYIREIIEQNDLVGGEYVEPYAGGAGVAMELLLDGVVGHVHLNDASPHIYAFWRSILTRTEDFCRQILSASMTIDEWRQQRAVFRQSSKHSQFEVGFSLFYLNRCNRSGIPTGGVIGGINQQGKWKMDARFSRNELISRIEAIASMRSQISVKKLDAEAYLTNYVPSLPKRTLVYCDPPYFHKADRLYINHYKPSDHARLARVVQAKVNHPWLVSYDAAPEIIHHYARRKSFTYSLQYQAGAVRKGNEVFFSSDDLVQPDRSSVKCINAGLQAALA